MVDQHIADHLSSFLNEPSPDFEVLIEFVPDLGETDRALLKYIDRYLNSELNFDDDQLKFTHLHLPHLSDHSTIKVLEFIIVKFYFKSFLDPSQQEMENCFFRHQLNVIEKMIKKPISLSDRNYRKEETRQKAEKKRLRGIKKFYSHLLEIDQTPKKLPIPVTLINTYNTYVSRLNEVIESNLLVKPLDGLSTAIHGWGLTESSYITLNSKKTFDQVDEYELAQDMFLIDHIENIILFHSDSRSIFKKINHSYLDHLNKDEECNFRNLLIISFSSTDFRLNKETHQLNKISSNYYKKSDGINLNSYALIQRELDFFHSNQNTLAQVELIGESNAFFSEFVRSLDENENLRELVSIKLRNIYSLCINDIIKQIILNEIFGNTQEYGFLTKETKLSIEELKESKRDELFESLDRILSIAIETGLHKHISQATNNDLCLIIPEVIIRNEVILKELRLAIGMNVYFETWRRYSDIKQENIVILEYRDTGFHHFNIYPNILETRFASTKNVRALYLTTFFEKNFTFNQFEYDQYLVNKMLDHSFRKAIFQWDALKSKIRSSKPERNSLNHLWDLENEYEGTSDHNSVIIEFDSKYCKTFYPTQLIVIRRLDEDTVSVLRAEELIEQSDNLELLAQPLDSLYEELNLFKITEEQEYEIKRLKKEYRLNENDGEARLWKELLKRRSNILGPDQVYDDITAEAGKLNVDMVSKLHFTNDWINPTSSSLIPRNKKMFKILCDYLELPHIYFMIMLKKKAKEKQNSRQSNSKMNALFIDLINSGVFENTENHEESRLKEIAKRHDFEEIGIASENQEAELAALIELSKTNLDLHRISGIQMKNE